MGNRAYVVNAFGEIVNVIVADPDVDLPPEGFTLVHAPEETPDSAPASGVSADVNPTE